VVRAIVFDFDGVLANSEPLHFRAYRDVLAADGVTLTEDEYYARYLGYDDRGAFEAIGRDRGRSWSPDEISTLVDRKAHTLEALETAGDLLFPGARAAVETAAAALPIAVASGARTAEILRALGHTGLAELFTAIVGAEDTARSKPAPDPYLKAVTLLHERRGPLSARECVAVEDSRWGLESARAAGLKTVGVTQTYDAASIGPADLVIPSMLAFDLEAIRQRFS
jgi:HAD superfamily hydrolase (TIGR01509 family)